MTETPTKPPEAPPKMEVIQGEKPYRLRDLTAKDTRTVGAMIAKVTGDPRIQNALAGGEQAVIVASIASALLDRASHDLYLWIADLIGEDKSVPPIKEYRRQEQREAREENRLPAPESELRYERELDIIEKIDSYPPETPIDIINDLIESERFERFLTSCSQLGTAAQKGFARFQKPSKNGSDGPIEK